MSTLAIEFVASRLVQTVYGTSNIVWANVIGLVLLSLTAGYFIGGRLADKHPRESVFYVLVSLAGFCAVFFLLLTGAVLRQAASALAVMDVNALVGSLVLVVLALVVPVTLLGCLSPFAIRLAVRDVAEAGRISGRIYAISTLGSLLGTYLPVLIVIPLAGSRAAAVLFGSLLLLVGLIGMWRSATPRQTLLTTLLFVLLLVPAITFWLRGGIKAYAGQVYEAESAYNYIQVIRQGDCNYLLLNEGQAFHSFYCDGDRVPEISVWSIMLAAPYFNAQPRPPRTMAVVGLAAGTIPKQFTRVFGPLAIDGIELDPTIIAAGRRYFDLTEPNINAIAGDGRYTLSRLSGPYDVITIDAYKVPYIPWHLTTREFFSEVSDRLSADGVMAINVGRTPGDRRLVDAVSATLLDVFPTVHAIDVPGTLNTILVATKQPTTAGDLYANLAQLEPDAAPLLHDALATAAANLAPLGDRGRVMTDDRAPIEFISDSIVIRYLLEAGPSGLGTLDQ
ncbi:MAG: fused MFS/spermidine synthase [Anaerolineae bacterium]|nr:fused MFS/spermidine synthase [Promineifilum sp.]MCZ2114335.1 fused MFS/spermidine synthase [Anaerolineae bacterium]